MAKNKLVFKDLQEMLSVIRGEAKYAEFAEVKDIKTQKEVAKEKETTKEEVAKKTTKKVVKNNGSKM